MTRHSKHTFLTVAPAGATALVLFGLTACTDVAPVGMATTTGARPGAAGLGDTLHPGLGNGGYQVDRYDLDMRFTGDLKEYTATTTLRGRATQALSRFNLDLAGPEVRDVTVDGRKARWSQSGQEVRVTPRTALPDGGEFTVRVTVGARVSSEPGRGLFRDKGFVQTLSQPSFAHRMAAFADHPAQKAPATITITAPSRMNSIANGELASVRRDGDFTMRRFENQEKLAPELIQIGVGPFTVVKRQGPDGLKLRHAIPSDQVNAVSPYVDKVIPEALSFVTKRLGPLPLRTYGLYLTPLGGGLETQSLTVMGTEEFSEEGMSMHVDSIATHEMAHEYFGNSVSPRRWSDAWLNEGHATFYEYLWDEEKYGISMEERLREAHQEASSKLRKEGPVAAPRREGFEPHPEMAPYGWGIYEGGALALYALRHEVGAATFQRIERAWVSKHRDGTASTADFIALASAEAGRDLEPFMRTWLYSEKLPALPGTAR
ncbi:M1 family metallopeptidase [Streptomyces sp. HC44]|uniref:M1 family metallopeptidase n=1 Tax=Streptomyces scabichelini TaxID=2711217 RepID=A0A6G4VCD2_9ACTN|nr:M1 family metallopeptidase [Streptomyces scabichelini]NGO11477.1 M1 family metallopeptidase [Streptomyces scabichelini]